jgi:hypothetical protein
VPIAIMAIGPFSGSSRWLAAAVAVVYVPTSLLLVVGARKRQDDALRLFAEGWRIFASPPRDARVHCGSAAWSD